MGGATTVVLILLVGITACQQPNVATPRGESNLNKKGGSGEPQKADERPREDEEGLESYLLTHAAAEALIAKPFLSAKTLPNEIEKPSITSAANGKAVEDFLRNFIDDVVDIKELQATRDIKTRLIDDETLNAAMDGWHRMTVNSGIVTAEDTESALLATICHELGHSARNHGYFSYFPEKDSQPGIVAAEGVLVEMTEYWQGQYSDGVYRHDQAKYQELWEKWKKVEKAYSADTKRMESEADAVGTYICGHLGLSVDEMIESEGRVLGEDSPFDLEPTDLQDGDEVDVDNEIDFVFTYLFPSDSHPQPSERLAQLDRLADVLAPKDAAEPGMYRRWQEDYPVAREETLDAMGLSLTSRLASSHRVVGRVRGSAEVLTVRNNGFEH